MNRIEVIKISTSLSNNSKKLADKLVGSAWLNLIHNRIIEYPCSPIIDDEYWYNNIKDLGGLKQGVSFGNVMKVIFMFEPFYQRISRAINKQKKNEVKRSIYEQIPGVVAYAKDYYNNKLGINNGELTFDPKIPLGMINVGNCKDFHVSCKPTNDNKIFIVNRIVANKPNSIKKCYISIHSRSIYLYTDKLADARKFITKNIRWTIYWELFVGSWA